MSIVDLNDSKQLVSYIGSSLSKTVIYNPNDSVYIPNYGTTDQVLTPQLFIAGTATDVISSAKSIKWFYQTNSGGTITEITVNTVDYTLGTTGAKPLTITSNVLSSNTSMSYICEIIYTDTETGFDVITKSEIELVKITNGTNGHDSYTHIAYANNDTGTSGFSVSDGTNKSYVGMRVDSVVNDSTNPSDYNWSLIKGADGTQGIKGTTGDDGLTSYLHIAYANDSTGVSGFSITDSTGKDYIGQYTDFVSADSSTPSDYTWVLIKGEQGETGLRGLHGIDGDQGIKGNDGSDGTDGINSVLATVWTPDGNVLKNGQGTLEATVDVYDGTTEVTPTAFKWYIQDPSSAGDSDSGAGWKLLNGTYNAGTSGYTTAKLTIPASAIASVESFMCIATYGGKKYRDICVVMDVTDPILVTVIGLNTFKNGQGSSEFEAKLYRNGAEIDSSGTEYTYAWSLYNSNNIKQSFSKAGKTITVNATDIDARANLLCEISK